MIATLALSALLLGPPAVPETGETILQMAQAASETPASKRQRPARRTARRRAAPPQAELPPPPPPAAPLPEQQADLAPMPNRSVEAPRQPFAPDTTRIRPEFIEPRRLPDTQGHSPNDYMTQRDSLFRDPAPGARLQIPFSY